MRLDRPYLVWRALCVLAEIAAADEAGGSVSDHQLRFLLGFLFVAGDRTRLGFDLFARQLREERTLRPQDSYSRHSYLNTGIAAIVRSIGPEPTSALLATIGPRASYDDFRAEVRRQIDLGERKAIRPDAWL